MEPSGVNVSESLADGITEPTQVNPVFVEASIMGRSKPTPPQHSRCRWDCGSEIGFLGGVPKHTPWRRHSATRGFTEALSISKRQ